jgi:cysteinyl-tRNA synthetase
LNFTWDALEAAQTALSRVWEAVAELVQVGGPGELDADTEPYRDAFHQAINRDLDLPGALAVLHEVTGSALSPPQRLALLSDFDRVLGLDLLATGTKLSHISRDEKALLAERAEARRTKDWATSDAIRRQLAEGGLDVKDTPDGQRWVRRDVLPAKRDDPENTATQDTED